jgi:hypothetical protein
LEITITKTSIVVFSSLNEAFTNAVTNQLSTREENIVIVKNYLGIDLDLFLSESTLKTRTSAAYTKSMKGKSKPIIQTETLVIKSGEEISLIATDLKKVELNIGLKLDNQSELSRKITCRGHTIRYFLFYFKYVYSKFFIQFFTIDVIICRRSHTLEMNIGNGSLRSKTLTPSRRRSHSNRMHKSSINSIFL